jgi:membrane protein
MSVIWRRAPGSPSQPSDCWCFSSGDRPNYTVVALAPLLVIVVAIAGLAFGQEAARGQVVAQIASLVGQQSAEQIQGIIASAGQPKSGILATASGVATMLFGASGVFGQL